MYYDPSNNKDTYTNLFKWIQKLTLDLTFLYYFDHQGSTLPNCLQYSVDLKRFYQLNSRMKFFKKNKIDFEKLINDANNKFSIFFNPEN